MLDTDLGPVGTGPLSEAQLKDYLRGRHFDVPAGVVLMLVEDGARDAGGIGETILRMLHDAAIAPPYVAKLVQADLTHKTELGAIRIGLTESTLSDALTDLLTIAMGRPTHQGLGLLVEEFIPGGVELFAGMTIDRTFGRIGVVGLGGIGMADRANRAIAALPVKLRDLTRHLLAPVESSLRRLGAVERLTQVLFRLMGEGGALLDAKLEEVDLNPIIVTRNRIVIADAWGRASAKAIEGDPVVPLANRQEA